MKYMQIEVVTRALVKAELLRTISTCLLPLLFSTPSQSAFTANPLPASPAATPPSVPMATVQPGLQFPLPSDATSQLSQAGPSWSHTSFAQGLPWPQTVPP